MRAFLLIIGVIAVLCAVILTQYKFDFEELAEVMGTSGNQKPSRSESTASLDKRGKEAERAILRELKQINSLTDMGVNYERYSDKIIEVKPKIDELLSEVKNEEFKQAASGTMQIYVDAYTLWNLITQDRYGQPPLSQARIEYFSRYSMLFKFNRSGSEVWVDRKAVSAMWAGATVLIGECERRQTK